ncbi:MAG TPA: uroporphyrinogen decarboxylase [Caulobacteraceae bacterium]|nr:uroporphyrinogen decarboxylase [Caulobacteraceae bacterium]
MSGSASPSPPNLAPPTKPALLRVLAGERTKRPPIWFMRQAGRYLPEYRALRAETSDFISFCMDSQRAAQATLQPMRRYPFDAAIVFADILLIPGALGQDVWFEAGEGPRLGPLPSLQAMRDKVEGAAEKLGAVGETLSLVRAALEPERALIGFAGAPWTVATYMIEGRSSDRSRARTLAYADPETMDGLIEVLVEASARYLAMQARAGAQALKLFESWAEGLPEDLFQRLVVRPHRRIIARLRELGVETPVIGFPRGAGAMVLDYAREVDVQAVALDTAAPATLGRAVQAIKPIQGALDPLLLRAGGPALDRRVEQLLDQWDAGPYIFNLGHGILPDTPPEHVGRVVARVTGKSGGTSC